MIKFKYFFDSTLGTPNENEVNKWLRENQNITIINTTINNGCLAIFYKEEIADPLRRCYD